MSNYGPYQLLNDNQFETTYSISYLAFSKENEIKKYLYRNDDEFEEAYIEAIKKFHKLSLFPSKIIESPKFRREFIVLARYVVGIRVQRIILTQSLDEIKANLKRLQELNTTCNTIFATINERNNLLEIELDYLSQGYNHPTSTKNAIEVSRMYNSLSYDATIKMMKIVLENTTVSIYPEERLFALSLIKVWNIISVYFSKNPKPKTEINPSNTPLLLLMRWDSTIIPVDTKKQNRPWSGGSNSEKNKKAAMEQMIRDIYTVLYESANPKDTSSNSNGKYISKSSEKGLDSDIHKTFNTIRNIFTDQQSKKSSSKITDSDTIFTTEIENLLVFIAIFFSKYILETFLRVEDKWVNTLILLRKDRINKYGGKLVLETKPLPGFDQSYETEYDLNNELIASIPCSINEYIDTDVLHNTEQRIKYTAVGALIETKNKELVNKQFLTRGELTCLVQFGFQCVCIHLQRYARGYIVRKNMDRYRWEYAEYIRLKREKAAIKIQSHCRRYLCRNVLATLRYAKLLKLQNKAATLIQKIIRGWVKRSQYIKYLKWKFLQKQIAAATLIQSIVRMRIQYKLYQAFLKQKRAHEYFLLQTRSATKIQALIRGYIARTIIIKSLRIRKRLSPDILKLAENYLMQGDLWKFLCDVNDELVRVKSDAQVEQMRENTMASTFVTHVLKYRQDQFDTSWNIFSSELEKREDLKSRQRSSQAAHRPIRNITSSSGQRENTDGVSNMSALGVVTSPLVHLSSYNNTNTNTANRNLESSSSARQPVSREKASRSSSRGHNRPSSTNSISGSLIYIVIINIEYIVYIFY